MSPTPEKLVVTSALPYANGPIHFGHVVGAYLPADIYVRFRRMCGDDVHFICGSDEHGVAITLKAEQAGKSYEEYVDHWHGEIKRILTDVDIQFDIFSGTAKHRNPFHEELAQGFFTDLKENGFLEAKEEEQFYSNKLQRFLPDRYVEGTCYKCGHENARGDECPSCGSWLDAKQLKDPRSTLDGSKPELRKTKHWYLQLDKIRDEWLQEWFESKTDDWKPNVRHFVKEALKGLRERPITRDLPWGVPVPLAGEEDKVLYVWFEAPIGYLSISKQYFTEQGNPEGFEQLWKDKNTKLYHFIGKDNITFHVVVFPSMLHGSQAGWIVPENVPANEFFNLEGKKFNTSAGWFIPEESIKGHYPVDSIRYALCTMMPETADSDWSWKEFQSRLNDDLADNLGNFVARTLRFAERFCDGVIPELGELRSQDQDILAAGEAASKEIAEHLASFNFRKACLRLMALGNDCNKYYDQEQPWKTRKTDSQSCGQTLRICAEMIRCLAVLMTPIMPNTSGTLLQALGIQEPASWRAAAGLGLPVGPLRAEPLPVLFPKVDNKAIEQELAKLKKMEKSNESTPAAAVTPAPEAKEATDLAAEIQFDQFTAVDLRVGTIQAAEKHPKADRLLVLQVDLGFEQRCVVAGVAESYSPDELLDRQVIVVANLAPRKLRGIESRGMILATNNAEGLPKFLAPTPGTANGTRVS